jgi:peroxiredoxin
VRILNPVSRIICLVVLGVIALASSSFAQRPDTVDAEDLKLGDLVPNIITKETRGRDVNLLADYRGKVVLLLFWSETCEECVEDMELFVQGYKRWHENGFDVLSVNLDEDGAHDYELPWRQIADGEGMRSPVAQRFGVVDLPRTILLGPRGDVIVNGLRGAKLGPILNEALGNNAANKAYLAKLAAIDKAIRTGKPDVSLKLTEELIESRDFRGGDLQKLAFAHCFTAPAHAKTVFKLADAAIKRLERDSESSDSRIAKAAAAIEMGGYYLADSAMDWLSRYDRSRYQSDPDVQRLRLSKFVKLGDTEGAWQELYDQMQTGAFYTVVKEARDKLNTAPPEAASIVNKVNDFITLQEALPADRVTVRTMVVDEEPYLRVTYNTRNTPYQGALTLKTFVRFDDDPWGSAIIEDYADFTFTATIMVPPESKTATIYFADSASFTDSNRGMYWTVKIGDQ